MSEPEVADATRRTRLANERTYLAWLRSALTALAVAIGAGKIVPGVANVSKWPFELLGAGFAVLGLVFAIGGARRFVAVEHALDTGRYATLTRGESILIGVIAAILGLATLVLVFVQ